MKKIYVSPSVTTINVEIERVVCGSLGSETTPNGVWNESEIDEVSGEYADTKSVFDYNVWE